MEKENSTLVLSPPYAAHHDSKAGESGERQKSIFSIVLEIIKDLRPGMDLLQYQVPVQLNITKSQLQLYTEPLYCCNPDLLTACASAATPLQRFLRVVTWNLSYNRHLPYCLAPFNPVLGETHHVSSGSLNLIAEQVSHHPPISAIYATNEECGIRFRMWARADAHFRGNRAETEFLGDRTLWLDNHDERYDMTMPFLMIRLFPTTGNEWTRSSTVKCKSSGLEAIINYKSKPLLGLKGSAGHVTGKIKSTFSGTVLFELSGHWDRVVMLKDVKTGEATVLYDAKSVLSSSTRTIVLRNQKSCELPNPPKAGMLGLQGFQNLQAKLDPTESVLVWRAAMEALMRRDYEAAKAAKNEVEKRQRELAKIRKQEGKVWEQRHFVEVPGDGWHWKHVGKPVPEAPLVYYYSSQNHQSDDQYHQHHQKQRHHHHHHHHLNQYTQPQAH